MAEANIHYLGNDFVIDGLENNSINSITLTAKTQNLVANYIRFFHRAEPRDFHIARDCRGDSTTLPPDLPARCRRNYTSLDVVGGWESCFTLSPVKPYY